MTRPTWEILRKSDNHWRHIARERLAAEAKDLPAQRPEMVLDVDVLGRQIPVLITLEDLRAVRESARMITATKIVESYETVQQARGAREIPEHEVPDLAREVFRAKAVHEREFLRTYAFWKAVEVLHREGGRRSARARRAAGRRR